MATNKMAEEKLAANKPKGLKSAIVEFLHLESAAGAILLLTSVLALVIANSPLQGLYQQLLDTTVAVEVGALEIRKPLLLWINDGLMAIFFFLIGLEIKREFLEGELSSADQIVLPAAGAFGGMVVPAGLYVWLNWGDTAALNGWAIPVATDIAFALAVLAAFGARAPTTLKIFLLTLAIFDDLAAIIIIALFYSENVSTTLLLFGAAVLAIAITMNRRGVSHTSSYILLGIVLWVAVLKSGVHATLAGVLIAFCIPMRDAEGGSPLRRLEKDLHTPVAFAILPLFAFANAGLSLANMQLSDLGSATTLGISIGLLLGKPVGILCCVGLVVAIGAARLPAGTTWPQILGASFACGIGFTMSLFIAGLAFEASGDGQPMGDRLGILVGSALSAIAALTVLHFALPREASGEAGN